MQRRRWEKEEGNKLGEEEKQNQSYNIACLKKPDPTKASFIQAMGPAPPGLSYLSKCAEDILDSSCQVKMKTFSV